MRRGLTMVEVLVSLGILGAVMLAVGAWIGTTAGFVGEAAGPAQWIRAAACVQRLIAEDLLIGDVVAKDALPKVRIVEGVLEIRTRAAGAGSEHAGPVVHAYRLDPMRSWLELEQRAEPDRGGVSQRRRLLDGITEFTCALDEEHAILAVTVESAGRDPLRWSFPLP